jgi:signal transduction histidine kinase
MLHIGLYGPISLEQEQVTAKILKSTEDLTNMVNELLDEAQLAAGKFRLNITPFNPREIVENTLAKMSILAQKKKLTVTTDITPDIPPILMGDQTRLQQILVNLVSNAIKFTDHGSVQVRLYLPHSTQWAIQVTDTGCGIPPQEQANIFEPFRQVDGSMTRRQSGTGLGLTIVKQLTDLMKGQIKLTSQVGQGSRFTIILPLITVEEKIYA